MFSPLQCWFYNLFNLAAHYILKHKFNYTEDVYTVILKIQVLACSGWECGSPVGENGPMDISGKNCQDVLVSNDLQELCRLTLENQ